ncbi:hypothetical protein ACET3Z_004999 [Daucus carota]
MKTTYVGGTTSEVPVFVDADKMSYSVVMEYVKELEYTEIGGLYVKMVPHGWYLISNDNDLIRFIDGVKGDKLEFYIDTVVDKFIQPREEMQPHVRLIAQTGLASKRTFVTIQRLQKGRKKGKLAGEKTSPEIEPWDQEKMLPRVVSNEKEEDDLHLDKEYVPEDDGLSEEEEEAENVKPKKDTKKKELKRKKGDKPPTNPARPRTCSTTHLTKTQDAPPATQDAPQPLINKTVSPVQTEILPPPPPLPKNFPPHLLSTVSTNNEGIGTMEAYIEMRRRQKAEEVENNQVQDVGQPSNDETPETDEAEKAFPKDEVYLVTRKRKPGRKYKIPVGKEDDDGANNGDANNGDANNGDANNGDAEANNGDANNNDADTTVEKIKKPAHGPNWLLGRSGRSRKTKKEHLNLENAQSIADHTGSKKAIRDELLAEMEEMIEKKIRDKMDVGRSGPGPLDGRLLTLQSVHRSQVVWDNREEEQLSAMQRAIDPYAPDWGQANHILQDMIARAQRRPTEQAPARPRARAPARRRGRPPVTPVVPKEGTYYTHVGSSHLAGTSHSTGHDGAEDQQHTPPLFTQVPPFWSPTYRFGSPPMMTTTCEGFTTPLPSFASYAGDSSPWAYAPVRPPRAAAQPSDPEEVSDPEEPSEHEQRQQPPRAAKGKDRRCHTGSHFFGHKKK